MILQRSFPRKSFLTITLTGFLIIAIFAFVFTACNRGANQSTASYGSQTHTSDTEEGFDAGFDPSYDTEEGFSDGFDPSYFLDGDFWFTVGDTGLKVGRVNQATLNQLSSYHSFFEESVPLEYMIIFTSTNAIDLEYLAIRMEYDEAKGEFFLIEEASIASSIPDTPFVVNWEPQTEFPHRAVAFYDRNNIKRYFTISGNDSGEGAPVLLIERQAGKSRHYSAQDIIHWWRFESGSNLLFFQSNMTVEFIPDGNVKVYFVTEGEAYNLIREGTWHLSNGNELFIEGEKGLGGGTPSYGFTFTITGDTLTITDHIDATAVFRRFEFRG